MVDAYGMGENGLVNMRILNRETGEASAKYIVQMADALRARCVEMMEAHYGQLVKLAEALLEKDTLYEEEIDRLIKSA